MFVIFVNAGVQKWRIFVCSAPHFPSFNWWKIWFYANRGNIEKKSMHWKEIGETDGAQILMALLCNESPMSPLPDGFPCLFLPATVLKQLTKQAVFQHLVLLFLCASSPKDSGFQYRICGQYFMRNSFQLEQLTPWHDSGPSTCVTVLTKPCHLNLSIQLSTRVFASTNTK